MQTEDHYHNKSGHVPHAIVIAIDYVHVSSMIHDVFHEYCVYGTGSLQSFSIGLTRFSFHLRDVAIHLTDVSFQLTDISLHAINRSAIVQAWSKFEANLKAIGKLFLSAFRL